MQVENGGPQQLESVRVDVIGAAFSTSTFVQASGDYAVTDVPVGTYTVIARLTGYTQARADGVTV